MNTVVFDLDGTLLPMNQEEFFKVYNQQLGKAFAHLVEPKKMIESLWASTRYTIMNTEKRTNLDKFFGDFSKRVERDVNDFVDRFDTFYDNEFLEARHCTHISGEIVESIKILKDKGYRLMIATNPMLPLKANYRRVEWAGLNKDDFEYISSFEENMHCKPHLSFYEEVVEKTGIDPKEAYMVGNDAQEDLVARNLGFKTYLITDCLIDRGDSYETDYTGTYKDFLKFVKNLPKLD